MTMPAVEQSGWREGRECTVCPPWVVRCAHYDGRVVYVGQPIVGQYEVHGPTKILIESSDPAIQRHDPCIPDCFPEPDAARAEFRRREAQLLGVEVGL